VGIILGMSSEQTNVGVVRRVLDGGAAALTVLAPLAIVVRFATPMGQRHADAIARLDTVLLVWFLAEVVLRLLLAERRAEHLRRRWFDLVAFFALVQALGGMQSAWAWFLGRQVCVLASTLLHQRRMRRLVSQLRLRPAKLMVGSFAVAIGLGAMFLLLPMATHAEAGISAVDALFTATSAVCVTGLIVKDTGADFTLFGQFVILVLIQLGGLGLMTFSVAIVMALGRSLSKSREVVMRDMLDQDSVQDMVQLLRFIALTTLVVEAVGAVLLYLSLSAHVGHSWGTAYSAVFHSVSAFCNAGFSLYSTSFEAFHGQLGVNAVICGLIIVGGLGFPVLRDLALVGARRRLGAGRPPCLRTQTKVVLTTSVVLLAVGAAVFHVTEAGGTLDGMGPGRRLLVSFFQSVTARTAGFNTVNIGSVGPAALVLIMFLMFIGASPGSTGGGVKTTTVAVLWQAMWAGFRSRGQTECFRRTVPAETVRRAVGLVVLSVLVICIWLIALLSTEAALDFEDVVFEVFSAFGTVGLSTGVTSKLTEAGRVLVTALMFIGRLGPLTLAFSLLGERRPAAYAYPEERIMVG